MPELPEVETIARELQVVVGRRIIGVEVRWARTVAAPDAAVFVRRLQGQRIRTVGRRGKWLVLQLDGGEYLLIHLRMSGQIVLGQEAGAGAVSAVRVVLALDDGQRLWFSDPRKFGRMVLTADPAGVLNGLGPEPLEEGFTPQRLGGLLAGRRARLKPLLMDQHFLAGLGNIYTDEILWRARLHPLQSANTLSDQEVVRLHQAIREVLMEAIAGRGSTLQDGRYVGPDGLPGDFASRLVVYQRDGKPCPRCGTPIERMIVGGRGTHFCPGCQRL